MMRARCPLARVKAVCTDRCPFAGVYFLGSSQNLEFQLRAFFYIAVEFVANERADFENHWLGDRVEDMGRLLAAGD